MIVKKIYDSKFKFFKRLKILLKITIISIKHRYVSILIAML